MNSSFVVGPRKVLYSGSILKDSGPSLHDLTASLTVQNTYGGYRPIVKSFAIDPIISGSDDSHSWDISGFPVVIRGMWHPGDYQNWTIWAVVEREVSETLARTFGIKWSIWTHLEFFVGIQYLTLNRTGTIVISIPEGR